MAKFTPYALEALPSSGIDVNGLYFIKASGDSNFKIYIRKSDNSDWVSLGTVDSVDAVNSLTGNVKIDLDFTGGKLKISATGTGTAASVAEIDLDARYRQNGADIDWDDIINAPDFALDSSVVHKTGNETIAGTKTFSNNVVVPQTPSANTHAASKKYVDDADGNLQDQIDALELMVDAGMRVPTGIDCSSNPNYPASTKGDTYKVTVAGKIGGASGPVVEIGDLIVCQVTSAAGTHATVGSNFFIVQSNIDQATESVQGFAKLATQALTDAGVDDLTIVTPKKLQKKINDNNTTSETSNDGRYVRHDTAAQGLNSTQKSNARTNIGAADDTAVVKLTGAQTVAGVKTFSSIPVLPATNPSTDNQVARKKYVDDTTAAAVAWGGTNGKEW